MNKIMWSNGFVIERLRFMGILKSRNHVQDKGYRNPIPQIIVGASLPKFMNRESEDI